MISFYVINEVDSLVTMAKIITLVTNVDKNVFEK